jgi:hypothetical protein
MVSSRAAFRHRYLASSPEERLAFLADLFEAQGWRVTHLTNALEIRRSPGGSSRTVRLVDESALDETDADVAVIAAPATDAEDVDGVSVVDTAELYDRVRYGVESEVSDRLLRTHLGDVTGREPSEASGIPADSIEEQALTADNETDDTAAATVRFARTRRALLVATGAVLGGAGTLGWTRFVDGQATVRAPGVTRGGIEEPGTLAAAHMSALQTRSYTLGLEHVRRDDDLAIRSSYGLDLALSAERAFLAVVSTDGPDAPLILGEPPAESHFYSDGQEHYVDHAPDLDEGAVSFDPPRGFVGTWEYWAYLFVFGGVLGSTPEMYYRNVFEAIPTRLVDAREEGDGTLYRLRSTASTLSGAPEDFTGRDVRDVDLNTVVDDRGIVRRLTLAYRSTVDGTPSRISRQIEYTGVGETEVTRPLWAD